jgi:hypothetical protein
MMNKNLFNKNTLLTRFVPRAFVHRQVEGTPERVHIVSALRLGKACAHRGNASVTWQQNTSVVG